MTRTSVMLALMQRMAGHPIEQLYRTHSRPVLAHCVGVLGNASAGSDAMHDAFERLMRAHARALFEDQHAVPYLYRTATNVCRDMLRHQRVWHRLRPELCLRLRRPGRSESLHAERCFARVLLRRVTPMTAAVGLMHMVDGMNQQEIASEVGLSRRSIFSHLKKLEQSARQLAAEASHSEPPSR